MTTTEVQQNSLFYYEFRTFLTLPKVRAFRTDGAEVRQRREMRTRQSSASYSTKSTNKRSSMYTAHLAGLPSFKSELPETEESYKQVI